MKKASETHLQSSQGKLSSELQKGYLISEAIFIFERHGKS